MKLDLIRQITCKYIYFSLDAIHPKLVELIVAYEIILQHLHFYSFLALKKPMFVDGNKVAVDSNEPMLSDRKLDEVLNSNTFRDLSWNNYFEDIGEGRRYKGQWIKPKDWAGGERAKGYARDRQGHHDDRSVNFNKQTQWMGFGVIEYPDGSKYSG
jgi:hypothetical protein